MRQRSSFVIANLIRQLRSQHKGCFVVVEGPDDRRFFEHVLDTDACTVVVAGGKPKVIDVINILEKDQFPGVVGIADADFDRIEGHEWESDNLILVEPVDLEAMLIQSSALDRIVAEFGSSGKLEKFGKDVRNTLVETAIPIGCLRLHSRRTGLNMKFQNLKYSSFIDRRSLNIDMHSFIRHVKNRSRLAGLPCHDLERGLRSIADTLADPWLVCTGDDLVSILNVGLRWSLGTNSARSVAYEVLCRCLRLGYQSEDFDNSQLLADLQEWTGRNPGYRVLHNRPREM